MSYDVIFDHPAKNNLHPVLLITMASSVDIVRFFFSSGKDKLACMKLAYWAHAHHVVFFGQPLFKDDVIQKWQSGPVPIGAYHAWNTVVETKSQAAHFSQEVQLLLTCILEWYPHDAVTLMNLIHCESPWKMTQLFDEITQSQLESYFSNHKDAQPRLVEYFGRVMGGGGGEDQCIEYFRRTIAADDALMAAHRQSAEECNITLLSFLHHGFKSWHRAERDGIL